MKKLYGNKDKRTDNGREFASEIFLAVNLTFEKWFKLGYSARDLESVAKDEIFEICCNEICFGDRYDKRDDE